MSTTRTGDLAEDPRIKSVSELQASIEDEIAAVKDGSLAEAKGRIIGTMRRNQYRGIELFIQAARLDVNLRRDVGRQFRRERSLTAAPEAGKPEVAAPATAETPSAPPVTEKPKPEPEPDHQKHAGKD